MATPCPIYTVRRATREDVSVIYTMTGVEGWQFPIGLLYCVFDMDSRAWFVAETEEGEIVGVRALVYYNENLTIGGLYIVKEHLRGLGIGRAVNKAAEAATGNDANIIISATNVNLYNTHGYIQDYDVSMKIGSAAMLLDKLPVHSNGGLQIKSFSEEMFSRVTSYYSRICKLDTTYLCRNWIIDAAKYVSVAFSESGDVVGYGCLRNTEFGIELSPLYADSDIIAWSLISELLSKLDPRDEVQLYVHEMNRTMMKFIGMLDAKHVITLYKMHSKRMLDSDIEKSYCMAFICVTPM